MYLICLDYIHNLQKSGHLYGSGRMDQRGISSGFHRIRNVFLLCEVMVFRRIVLSLCFVADMHIIFDLAAPLLRRTPPQSKHQYIKTFIKRKKQKR